jgi:alkylresorcinol/alkylpyrone synthase
VTALSDKRDERDTTRKSGLARITQLAVADPETSYSQQDVLTMLGLEGDEFAARMFDRCAVESRDLGAGPDAFTRTLQGRTTQTEDQLFEYAIKTVASLDLDPSDICTVVTASLYSLGGPTLAHRLIEHFRMDPATDKYHIVGVGCASAVPLIRLVAQSLHDHPGKKGLIVAAESMSGMLSHATPGDHRAKTVGSAIFGDGCAAMVIENGSSTTGPVVAASKVHQIEGTLGAVRMELSDDNSYLHLDRELPDLAAAGLAGLVDDFLAPHGLDRDNIDHWVVHPGGRRILECVRDALVLSREQVEASYTILARKGNVGTPSIFYVLGETIRTRRPKPGERALMVTVGPGITVGLMLLDF